MESNKNVDTYDKLLFICKELLKIATYVSIFKNFQRSAVLNNPFAPHLPTCPWFTHSLPFPMTAIDIAMRFLSARIKTGTVLGTKNLQCR